MRILNVKGYLKNQLSKISIPPYYNLKFLVINLKICGVWPPINGNKNRYIIWSIFALLISLGHALYAQTGFILAAEWVDTEEMASALSFLINNYVHLFKVTVVFRNQRRIQYLLDYADGKKFTCNDLETMKKLQYRFSWSAFMHYANFQFAGLAACTGWILSSALQSLKGKNDRSFPMNAWYGYDAMTSPLYEVTLVFQALALLMCCVHNISLDGLIIGFMAVVGCEFEILKTRIKEIGNDVEGLEANEYLTMNILKQEYIDERIYKELMLCVEHHLTIIAFAKEFEDIFQSAIFLQFLDNCCVICMTAFALAQLTEYSVTTILGNLMYLAAIIYQLFMYCYFGNVVSIQANFHVKVSLSIIFYMGIWPPDGNYRLIYLLYGILTFVFLLGIYLIVQAVYLIVVWGNVEKMVAGAFLLMTNTSHALKVFNIYWRKNRIEKLLEIVKSEKFSRYNSHYERILTRYAFRGIFHHIAYQSLATTAVFCWAFTPIADLISGHSRRLPMEAWYPYNVTNTPAFELTCIHQSLAAIVGCFQNIAMDTLVTGLITVACTQIEILKSNLCLIGSKSSISYKDIDDELKNCVEHHNAIIHFTKEIEAIFSTTIIVQFLVNCIIICLTAFHITKMKEFVPAELIGMTMYMCCMTYQIFIYCWHGNEIAIQSESVVFAAYSGNWWRCGERYKRGLRLLMTRAKEPLTLKAGNLLTLSLQTFVTILRASYSFFTVLQSSTN